MNMLQTDVSASSSQHHWTQLNLKLSLRGNLHVFIQTLSTAGQKLQAITASEVSWHMQIHIINTHTPSHLPVRVCSRYGNLQPHVRLDHISPSPLWLPEQREHNLQLFLIPHLQPALSVRGSDREIPLWRYSDEIHHRPTQLLHVCWCSAADWSQDQSRFSHHQSDLLCIFFPCLLILLPLFQNVCLLVLPSLSIKF